MKRIYQNLLEALEDLTVRGYVQSFGLTPAGLYCPLTKQVFTAAQLRIVEAHHFEGDSDVGDLAILYVIETNSGCKGVLIDAYGTYGSSDMGNILRTSKT
ncbi:phosphoribosylpyrophosphate synthetase [Flagellimonas nanhaiensis]|uniref:Phosphoribosylpyrophosphate synthetase n=1 Tax=Flagellimonas nanhaiensis TaxID=2292706 RepID=A0A371JN35_9FLAO|nr:phosphoribosylpyrophosphate synthetase [Allomuricauda nanhaiensis]RDY58633.1 phosphoribosylpyrophosphate synthetase [Allomuricauda nanhaiensis]